MTPLVPFVRGQGEQNKRILILMVSLLTGWVLALLYQCQQYVPDSLQVPDSGDLKAKRTRIVESGHESLLLLYYQQIGMPVSHLDPTGDVAPRKSAVVVMLYPRVQVPRKMEEQLVKFVREGGRLVIFTDCELDVVRRFGVNTVPMDLPEIVGEPVSATLDTVGVQGIRAPALQAVVSAGRPVVPLLQQDGATVAGLVGFGQGAVVVVTPRLTEHEWIADADNPIFLVNLVLGSPAWQQLNRFDGFCSIRLPEVQVLDYDANMLTRLYAIQKEEGNRVEEARRRWSYDSLWSLIRANPVSAGLLQLALALVVFGISRARRLGDPIPDRYGVSEFPGVLESHAIMMEKATTSRILAVRALNYLHGVLTRRLGLPGDAPVEEINAGLSNLEPSAAQLHTGLLKHLHLYASGKRIASETELIQIWRTVDEIRRRLDPK
jgi:hypothetical protein